MFYIDSRILGNKKESFLFHALPAIGVFTLFVILTVILTVLANETLQKEQNRVVTNRVNTTTASFTQRMSAYEDVLRGGAGLFGASLSVTREEWKAYVDAYNITERYPGIQGVGYAAMIPKNDLAVHIAAVRAEGFPDYTVYPSDNRDVYSSIVYLEPFSGANLRAFGYDMYSETVRRHAMDAARDANAAVVSDVVTLVQESDPTKTQPGFLMYVPLYRAPGDTLAERRQHLYGFVYAPFRSEDLMRNIVDTADTGYGFQLYKSTENGQELVFESQNFQNIASSHDSLLATSDIDLQGAHWSFKGVARKSVVGEDLANRPRAILITGLLFSALLAGLIYLLMLQRAAALNKRDEDTLQEAKDELLALASHQLRTPATGVKQYIGMLKDGMAGSLSPLQKHLVEKAYTSNERQLDTINEMLFVARADSGQLNIGTNKFDITEVLAQVVADMQDAIMQNEQTLKTDIRKKGYYVVGEAQYMRMAIENIVSNASKYTYGGGTIKVSIKRLGRKRVQVVVADTGVGIDKKDQKLLFQKFSRIPNELTNKVVGSGIGLYIVKKIVTAHHGTVQIVSAKDVGTTVTIKLPLA